MLGKEKESCEARGGLFRLLHLLVTHCSAVLVLLSLQVGIFYRDVLNAEEKTRLVENIAGHLKDALPAIQERAVGNFRQADKEYGDRIAALLKA